VGFGTLDSVRRTRRISEQALRAEELRGTALRFANETEMSARLAAVTGDAQWQQRYKQSAPALDEAIKAAIRMAPDLLAIQSAARADAANLKMNALAQTAFSAITNGHDADARQLLASGEFAAQERDRQNSIDASFKRLKDLAEARLKQERDKRTIYVEDGGGAIVALIGAWFFTTRRLRHSRSAARRELQQRIHAGQNVAYMAAIAQFTDDAAVAVAPDGVITAWNRGAEKLYGYSASEAIGQNVSILFSAEDARELPQIVETVMGGESIRQREASRVRKDGKLVDVSMTISPITDASGKVIGASTMARDVTESKNREREMTAGTKMVEVRNQEFEQSVFALAREVRERLLKCVQSLAALSKNLGDAERASMDLVVPEIQRTVSLIEDLGFYSRVGNEAGNNGTSADAQAAYARAIADLASQIQLARATVTTQQLPTVSADPDQLAQVFQELIGNAIRFRGEQPTQVEIAVKKNGKQWMFSVSDNGIGLDPSAAEQIFTPSDPDHPRSGLGLALCKKIVEQSGGQIWVESTAGKGTTFYFTLAAAPTAV
jgi:PAS domain S-box-containing protein